MRTSPAQWRRSLLEFVKVTLDTARVFLALAVTTNDLPARAKCVALAREAYGAALRFQGLIHLPSFEAEAMAGPMEDLQARLDGWGPGGYHWPASDTETMREHPGEKSIAEWVRDFEQDCARARQEAREIVARNREILSKAHEAWARPGSRL